MACRVEPPVVTTSSTIRQRSPGSSSGPSMRRCRPCCLVSLRTKKALTSAPPASAAQRRGVGAHGQAADGGRAPLARAVGDELGQGGEAGGPQDRALGVDVVLRGLAAGEDDLAHDEGVAAQLVDQPLPRLHAARTLSGVLEGLLRTVAVVAGAIVLLSFALFAIDETRDASERRRAGDRGSRGDAGVGSVGRPGARARARALARARVDRRRRRRARRALRPARRTARTARGCGAASRRCSP